MCVGTRVTSLVFQLKFLAEEHKKSCARSSQDILLIPQWPTICLWETYKQERRSCSPATCIQTHTATDSHTAHRHSDVSPLIDESLTVICHGSNGSESSVFPWLYTLQKMDGVHACKITGETEIIFLGVEQVRLCLPWPHIPGLWWICPIPF